MDSEGSITLLIEQVKQRGDEYAAQALFDRYFGQLMRVAARKLGGAPRGAEDEEGAALKRSRTRPTPGTGENQKYPRR